MDIIDRIAARPDGDVLNIVQAASELEGTVEERLTAAYAEVVPE